ncbi:hypothetical protein CO660_25805 [Rhizobium sp. L9]|nr:hypothetical protein CO660_25805 [Rhizobium sp. L9]
MRKRTGRVGNSPASSLAIGRKRKNPDVLQRAAAAWRGPQPRFENRLSAKRFQENQPHPLRLMALPRPLESFQIDGPL